MSTQKRRDGYYSRVSVPSDLRSSLQRREVVKRLGVDEYRTAKIRCARWEAHVASMFHEVRVKRDALTKESRENNMIISSCALEAAHSSSHRGMRVV